MAGQATQREAPAIVDMYGRAIPIRRRPAAATEKISGYDLALTADDVATAARETQRKSQKTAAAMGQTPAARTGAERVSGRAAAGGKGTASTKLIDDLVDAPASSVEDLATLLDDALGGSGKSVEEKLAVIIQQMISARAGSGLKLGGIWDWAAQRAKTAGKNILFVGIPAALIAFLYMRPDFREVIMSAIESGDYDRIVEFFTEDMPNAMEGFTPEEAEEFLKRLKEQESALGAGAGRLNVGQLKKIGLRYHILPKIGKTMSG